MASQYFANNDQAYPLTIRLGAEEWCKEMGGNVIADRLSIILYEQLATIQTKQNRLCFRDSQIILLCKALYSVAQQIDYHLLYLLCIAAD